MKNTRRKRCRLCNILKDKKDFSFIYDCCLDCSYKIESYCNCGTTDCSPCPYCDKKVK